MHKGFMYRPFVLQTSFNDSCQYEPYPFVKRYYYYYYHYYNHDYYYQSVACSVRVFHPINAVYNNIEKVRLFIMVIFHSSLI